MEFFRHILFYFSATKLIGSWGKWLTVSISDEEITLSKVKLGGKECFEIALIFLQIGKDRKFGTTGL